MGSEDRKEMIRNTYKRREIEDEEEEEGKEDQEEAR